MFHMVKKTWIELSMEILWHPMNVINNNMGIPMMATLAEMFGCTVRFHVQKMRHGKSKPFGILKKKGQCMVNKKGIGQ